ncbi:AAA family ATPase [Cohnella sp. GCM10027633]|uniref:AAA family ATPase n=1 Tax=unclassified Cohnella TaxID=2636738 RepID=UPI003643AD26
MYIRELKVDGYGALQGVELTLDAPVTVLYGPNEAGKSTLLRFMRSMLYGFPSRKDMVERGEPVRGGRHGGRMLLRGRDGREWLVERYAERGSGLVVRESGGPERQLSQTEWERLALGGITEKLFRQLFAVSLDELHQLRALQGEEVGNYLYHAGLAGGAALTEARRRIGAEMDRLYRPKGANQDINKAMAAIKETEAAIRQSKDHIQFFNEWTSELEETNRQLAEADARLPRLRELATEAKGAYELREWWLKTQSLRLADEEARGALPDPNSAPLPESAALRWSELKSRRGLLVEKLAQAGEAEEELVRERATYRWSEALLAAMPELERLESLREGIAARREEAAELEAERRMLDETLAGLLARLSPEWGEQELRAFGAAMSERERIRRLARDVEEAERSLQPIQGELERNARMQEALRAEAQVEEVAAAGSMPAQSRLERAEARPYAFVPSDRTNLLRAWHDLEDAMRAYERARQAYDSAYDGEHEAEASPIAATGRSQRSRRAGGGRSSGMTAVLLGGAAALLGLASVALPFVVSSGGNVSPAVVAFSAMMLLISGALGAMAYRSRPAVSGEPQSMRGSAARSKEAEANVRLLQAQAANRLSQLVRDPEAAVGLFTAAAVSGDATARPMASADEAWRRLREAVYARLDELEHAGRDAANREMVQRRMKELRTEREMLGRDATSANERIGELQTQWAEWLRRYRLPSSLDVDGSAELFHMAEQASAALRQRERVTERLQGMKRAIGQFEQAAAPLAASFELPPSVSSDLVLAVRWLYAEAAKQLQASLESGRIDRQLETSRSNVRRLRAQSDELEAEVAAFLEEAKATDERALELRLRIDERSRELRREARDAQLRLESGRDEAAKEKLHALLQAYDEASLAAKVAERDASLAAAEQDRTGLLDRRGRLMQELERLRTDAELADSRQTLAERESRLEALLERYAVLALGEKLMSRAKAVFEEERQPEVLRHASAYLRQMTGGAYERIVAPDDRSALLAETANRQLLDSAFLSRGTQEQLYLAMRFALCDAASRDNPLPLLLDDLFVHFDEKRLRNTLPVLETMAEGRQLILFTCHRHVADMLAEGINGATALSLH